MAKDVLSHVVVEDLFTSSVSAY